MTNMAGSHARDSAVHEAVVVAAPRFGPLTTDLYFILRRLQAYGLCISSSKNPIEPASKLERTEKCIVESRQISGFRFH